jgi:putative FmdB family regulatory protein
MPLYEFYCPPCGVQFEVLRPMSKSEDPALCPAGHWTSNRVVSMFATLTRTSEAGVASNSATAACACGGACSCN